MQLLSNKHLTVHVSRSVNRSVPWFWTNPSISFSISVIARSLGQNRSMGGRRFRFGGKTLPRGFGHFGCHVSPLSYEILQFWMSSLSCKIIVIWDLAISCKFIVIWDLAISCKSTNILPRSLALYRINFYNKRDANKFRYMGNVIQ